MGCGDVSNEDTCPEKRASVWNGDFLCEYGNLTSGCGQTEETKLKSLLDNIASFALVPHGFQRHKDRIVRLSEEVLSITRDGRPSTANVAQRFVSITIPSHCLKSFTPSWHHLP